MVPLDMFTLLSPNKWMRVRNRHLTLSFLFSQLLCASRELLKVRKEPPTKGKRKSRRSSQQVEALPVLSSQSGTPYNSWIWIEFSQVHMEDFCQDIDHILGHETNFPNFERSKL